MIVQDLETKGWNGYFGKPRIVSGFRKKLLISYNIPVAMIDKKGIHRLWNGWSNATGDHIKQFCGLSKEDFMKLPVETEKRLSLAAVDFVMKGV